jgi:hypothetical protein
MASTLPRPQPNAAESSSVNLALTEWWFAPKLFGFSFWGVLKHFNKRVRPTACTSHNTARVVKIRGRKMAEKSHLYLGLSRLLAKSRWFCGKCGLRPKLLGYCSKQILFDADIVRRRFATWISKFRFWQVTQVDNRLLALGTVNQQKLQASLSNSGKMSLDKQRGLASVVISRSNSHPHGGL